MPSSAQANILIQNLFIATSIEKATKAVIYQYKQHKPVVLPNGNVALFERAYCVVGLPCPPWTQKNLTGKKKGRNPAHINLIQVFDFFWIGVHKFFKFSKDKKNGSFLALSLGNFGIQTAYQCNSKL
ncbi:hypothetical protein AMTRI_Chr06g199020 [Amborella trichopoda]